MKIYSVFDKEFKPYGRVITGIDGTELMAAMETVAMPESGVNYEPAIDCLEACAAYADFRDSVFGGMPVELGMCWGYNTKLNCLEYHRDSEFNLGTEDFILLIAKMEDIDDNGKLDTAKVKAFRAPAGTLVEVYGTTLHYAPCHTDPAKGFHVMVALPQGTNTAKPAIQNATTEDGLLWACNKWLLAHPESGEAAQGAHVGLSGENIDIAGLL